MNPKQLPAHEADLVPVMSRPECVGCRAGDALKAALDELADLEQAALTVLRRVSFELTGDAADIARPAYRRAIDALGLATHAVYDARAKWRAAEGAASVDRARAELLGRRIEQLETLMQQSTERALELTRAGSPVQLAELRATLAAHSNSHATLTAAGVPALDERGRELTLDKRIAKLIADEQTFDAPDPAVQLTELARIVERGELVDALGRELTLDDTLASLIDAATGLPPATDADALTPPPRVGVEPVVHELKVANEFFDALADGSKTLELRRDDRGFRVGDELVLREVKRDPPPFIPAMSYTGRSLRRRVSHVVKGGPWLRPGFVALSLAELPPAVVEPSKRRRRARKSP